MGKCTMTKKLFTLLLVAGLSMSSTFTFSATAQSGYVSKDEGLPTRTISLDARQKEDRKQFYQSLTGIVQEITPYGQDEAAQLVTLDIGNGEINRIVITDQTYLFDEIAIGVEVIAFYDINAPMILIYPPQYTAVVVALVEEGRTIKVDRFDQNLVSADGMLKLNLSDKTKITLKDGTPYTGDLEDCNLAVVYRFATHSIPAQTTPEQIVVLGGPGCSS